MTTKHTPAPWEIDSDYVQQAGQTGVAICDVMCIDEGGNKGWYRGPITQANAHLISAAPDLLAGAEAAWNCIAELPSTPARVEAAQLLINAIAKAKGEQQ